MKLSAVIVWLLLSSSAFAVVETYQFDNDVLRERYQQFVAELRCPKCQNQNLSGSNSPIAKDLRRELYRLLHDGQSDQQIVDYMVSRYGDFILYRPRFNPETALLWLAPGLFLLIGLALAVTVFLRQKRAVSMQADGGVLDDHEQQQLQQLLADNKNQTNGGSASDA